MQSGRPHMRLRRGKARGIKNQLAGKHQTTSDRKKWVHMRQESLLEWQKAKWQNQFHFFFAFFSIFMQSEGSGEAHEIESLMHLEQLFWHCRLLRLVTRRKGGGGWRRVRGGRSWWMEKISALNCERVRGSPTSILLIKLHLKFQSLFSVCSQDSSL
jgi:hypothetical protein